MMSVDMKVAHAVAEKYDRALQATDPRFNGIVIVHSLDDFSSFTFANAFAMYYKEFFIVFTEHYGFHLYSEDSAAVVHYLKREGIAEIVEE